MIVLDTNVLVYAVGSEHRLAEPCRLLIEAIGDARVSAVTTPEVIQEFVHVRARRQGRRPAAVLGRSFAELLSPLLIVDGPVLDSGLRLFERAKKIGTFDAVLAAAALTAGAEALVSADAAFADIPGLARWDPAGPELARLLAEN